MASGREKRRSGDVKFWPIAGVRVENGLLSDSLGNQSFPKSVRLLQRSQFEAVMNHGQRTRVDTTLTLFFLSNGLNKKRLGIIASKKIGNAVIRNRAKRMIREAFRRLEYAGLPGMDVVVISGKNLVSLPLSDLETKILNNLPAIQ